MRAAAGHVGRRRRWAGVNRPPGVSVRKGECLGGGASRFSGGGSCGPRGRTGRGRACPRPTAGGRRWHMRLREHAPAAPGGGARVALGMGRELASGMAVGALMGSQGLLAYHGGYGWAVFALYAAVVGVLLGAFVGRWPSGPAVSAAGGLLLGLLGWAVWWLTLDPWLRAITPTWSVDAATAVHPELVGSLLQGTLAGMLFHLAVRGFPARPAREAAPAPRVVIVGGGFGGVGA